MFRGQLTLGLLGKFLIAAVIGVAALIVMQHSSSISYLEQEIRRLEATDERAKNTDDGHGDAIKKLGKQIEELKQVSEKRAKEFDSIKASVIVANEHIVTLTAENSLLKERVNKMNTSAITLNSVIDSIKSNLANSQGVTSGRLDDSEQLLEQLKAAVSSMQEQLFALSEKFSHSQEKQRERPNSSVPPQQPVLPPKDDNQLIDDGMDKFDPTTNPDASMMENKFDPTTNPDASKTNPDASNTNPDANKSNPLKPEKSASPSTEKPTATKPPGQLQPPNKPEKAQTIPQLDQTTNQPTQPTEPGKYEGMEDDSLPDDPTADASSSNPDASKANADARKTNPDESKTNPDASKPNPDPSKTNPDPSKTNPDPSKTNPDPSKTNPDASKTNPDPSKTNPDASKTNPDASKTNPDASKTNPDASNPNLNSEKPTSPSKVPTQEQMKGLSWGTMKDKSVSDPPKGDDPSNIPPKTTMGRIHKH